MYSPTIQFNQNNKFFRRTGILACSSVFLLFMLGGLVRVTGSGMGCPDWPKCFGLLKPPTCGCQLPPNYQEIYLKKRIAKLERFAQFLEKVGMPEKANAIRHDKTLYIPEAFNPYKAWTEYINRIFGVIAGLLVLTFAIATLKFRKNKMVVLMALLALFFLTLNAYLGSIVVATNLLPGIVTVHFLLSFLCIFSLLFALHAQSPFQYPGFEFAHKKAMIMLFVLLFLEVIFGTFAREQIEYLTSVNNLQSNTGMLNYQSMGPWFIVHRYLPGIVFLLASYFYYKNKNLMAGKPFAVLALLAIIQICFGALNIVLTLPSWSQVIHIVLGSFLPVYAFYYCIVKPGNELEEASILES